MNRKVQSGDNFSQQLSAKGLCATFADSMDFVLESTGVGVWEWHLPSGLVLYTRQWGRLSVQGLDVRPATNGGHGLLLPKTSPAIHTKILLYVDK